MPQADLTTYAGIVFGEFFIVFGTIIIVKVFTLFTTTSKLKIYNKYKHKNIIFYL